MISRFGRAVLGAALGLAVLGRAGTAHAEWQKAESAHFVVYSDGGESSLRDFTAKLEDFDALLRLFHGRAAGQDDGARKLDIYMVRSIDQLRRAFPDQERAAGVYTAGINDIFAVAIRKSDGLAEDTVLHEYVHHFMLQHYPGAYPAWLVEGYAEYFMTADIEDKKILVGAPNGSRVSGLLNGSWVSSRDLLTKRSSQIPEQQGAIYYGQAWLLAHYMLSDPERKKQLSAFVGATAKGEDPLVAWPKATGIQINDLERVMRGYLRSAIPNKTLVRDKQPNFPMTVTTLPPSTADLVLENQLAKRAPPKAMGEKLLRTVRGEAAPNGCGPRAITSWSTAAAKSEHFVVYGHSDRSVREYAAMLEDFDPCCAACTAGPRTRSRRASCRSIWSESRQLKRVLPKPRNGIAGVYCRPCPRCSWWRSATASPATTTRTRATTRCCTNTCTTSCCSTIPAPIRPGWSRAMPNIT
jgi:hypothetical protein